MANSIILTKAQNAVTAHDWTTAARLYKEMLRGNESNIEYLEQLGSIYVRAGQDEKAIPYYEQIITFSPQNTAAMISLGGIFRRLKRYNDSVDILHKAQDIESSPTINYNLGFTYKEMGDYEDAVDAFESVISRNPDDVLAHNHLGSIYYAQKEYEKSIAAFKRGLQVDQNHPILNYNLAHTYTDMKNYPDAVRCYEIALKTRPGWVDAIRDFSELLIKCQNTKQAQELVEQSIKLHPDDVDLLCILGRIYLNQFDYDNATKTFKRAESLKNNDIKILIGLSKSLEKGMKIEQAMEKILDAVDIAPENLDVCKQYAHVLLSAQRYDKALEMIKTIEEKSDGKDLQILDLYGQYFVCRGDEEAAATYFDKIKKINHHYKDYMINAADRYIQTGNYDKAEQFADMFVQCRPQLPEGYNVLGTVQNARGELKKAKSEYEKGVALKNPNIYAVKELEKIYSQLEKNKELYNDEETPIAVDASELEDENKEQDENPVSNGFVENEDGELEYTGVDNVSPIDESLAEDSDEFWEDFDDDPDAENKPLADEEDVYDENAEDANLMSYMTPDADNESLEEGLLKDDDEFDFGDLDDAAADVEGEEETGAAGEAAPDESGEDAASDMGVAAELEPEPDLEPDLFMPKTTAPVEDEPEPVKEPRPAAYEPEYKPEISRDDLLPELEKADRMMQDLKQQQRELELQQREFELQQKEFADELKHENEKLINEAVDKAVDEKLQAYDLPEAGEEVEEPVVEEPLIEEPLIEDEPVVEEIPEESVVEPELEEEPIAEPELEEEPEIPLGDELAIESETEFLSDEEPELELEDEPVIEPEEPVAEPEPEPVVEMSQSETFETVEEEPEVPEEPEIEPEPEEEPAENIDDLDMSLDYEKPYEDVDVDYTDYPFLSVDDVLLMAGGRIVLDSEEEEKASATEEEKSAEATSDEDLFITADDMLEKIERILNNDEIAATYTQEIELFKKLKVLADSLPESEKNKSSACRMRMMIDYIIAKMSGKPGLLATAESLLKSGVLGAEYDAQLTTPTDEELSNDLIRRVLMDMKKLAVDLEDKKLSETLCITADTILEKIALINQQVAIFG